MAFQAVPNTAEVTVLYTQNTEVLANVFHAELATGYNLADISALAVAVDAAVAAFLLPEMSTDAAYTRTEVRGLDVENDLFASSFASAGNGAQPTAGMPTNVTFSIKKVSGLTGRSARGRWYFVGAPVGSLSANENIYNVAGAAAMVNAVEGVRQAVVATVWSPVIVSRFTGGALRPVGVTFGWTTVVAVNDFVDTQRRRLTT